MDSGLKPHIRHKERWSTQNPQPNRNKKPKQNLQIHRRQRSSQRSTKSKQGVLKNQEPSTTKNMTASTETSQNLPKKVRTSPSRVNLESRNSAPHENQGAPSRTPNPIQPSIPPCDKLSHPKNPTSSIDQEGGKASPYQATNTKQPNTLTPLNVQLETNPIHYVQVKIENFKLYLLQKENLQALKNQVEKIYRAGFV